MATQLFEHERVIKHVTRIRTPFGVSVYLVEGSARAVLLDTGYGIGDLKGYVEGCTDKPYDVLLSHGHVDHVGGAAQFEHVWMNHADLGVAAEMSDPRVRLADATRKRALPNGVSRADVIAARTDGYKQLVEGDTWDLGGGVTVEALACPGHTRGSLIFLIQPDRAAIFGDSCGEHTLLLFEHSASIAAYRKALLHVQERADEFDLVLRNHGSGVSEKRILGDNIALCDDILAGCDAKIPVRFRDFAGCMGRPDEHPGVCGNILYDPSHLYEDGGDAR